MAVFIFIIGLVIGSFLNVCIYRIPRGESIAFPPSHCTKCGERIKPYDLVPVISYILLRGKCRKCGEKISIIYPCIEFLNAFFYLLLYIEYGISFQFFKFAFLISLFIVIGMIDFKTTDIYSSTIYTGLAGGIIFLIIGFFLKLNILDYILGAAIGGGIIALIIFITHGMGAGDAEMCLTAGLFLGIKCTVFMLFASFVFGGVIAIILLIKGKKKKRDYMPLGPFISIGTFVSIFLGSQIMNWYLNFL